MTSQETLGHGDSLESADIKVWDAVAASYYPSTEIIAALRLYHNKHGEYPETLDSLTEFLEKVPVDPFTLENFVYRKEGDPFTLYSPGPDLEDQQGQIHYDPTNGTLSGGDIVFSPRG